MTYQVLARKWRPQDFSSLVGQEQIVTALRNALTENRIAQAYLFSGIRGVGKTTAARVLAKALNCERRTSGDPCNECDACLETGSGNNMDVIEVDAATYSKVEQIRELTETLRYGPAGKYKVVVLDEVHRLSKQAFDALLKIVEEPPAHLVFIFATTEIDAVPATILSRCQEYQFRRVPSPILAGHLRTICDAESIEVSDVSLRLIARAGEGSVRDSVALLDQMATFGSGTITDEDAKKLLGGLDSAIFQKLLVGILSGEHPSILQVVADVEANGWDPHNVYSQFLSFTRDALHLALGASTESIDLPDEECKSLQQILKPYGYESLLQAIQLLISSEGMVRRSEMGLLALEIAWLRAAELPKVQKIQDLLTGQQVQTAPLRPGPASPGRSAGPVEVRSPTPPMRQIRRTEKEQDSAVAPAASASSTLSSVPEVERPETRPNHEEPSNPSTNLPPLSDSNIPALLELLGSRRQSLAAHLRNAGFRVKHRTLHIHPKSGDRLLIKALDRKQNQEALNQAIREVWGSDATWTVDNEPLDAGSFTDYSAQGSSKNFSEPRTENRRSAPGPRRPSPEPPPNFQEQDHGPPPDAMGPPMGEAPSRASVSKADMEAVAELPTVRSVLEIFGGTIRNIEDLTKDSDSESQHEDSPS